MTEHDRVRSEEDSISTSKILAVGIGSLLIFFLASVVTSMYFRVNVGAHPAVPTLPEIGRSKIGMVEQQPFDKVRRGSLDRAARLERLHSFGWADERRRVAHIPIDLAMELVEAGVRPLPGAPPAPPPGGQP